MIRREKRTWIPYILGAVVIFSIVLLFLSWPFSSPAEPLEMGGWKPEKLQSSEGTPFHPNHPVVDEKEESAAMNRNSLEKDYLNYEFDMLSYAKEAVPPALLNIILSHDPNAFQKIVADLKQPIIEIISEGGGQDDPKVRGLVQALLSRAIKRWMAGQLSEDEGETEMIFQDLHRIPVHLLPTSPYVAQLQEQRENGIIDNAYPDEELLNALKKEIEEALEDRVY